MTNSLYEYFVDAVAKHPTRTAVVSGNDRISYQELNEKIDVLAEFLKAKDVGPEKVVGLLFHRSVDIVTALLAVMKVGGAFMIIDADYPLERIQLMIRDSNAVLVLSNSMSMKKIPFTEIDGFTKNDCEIVCTEKRAPLDFNLLPWPDRSLINFESYSKYCKMSLSRKVVTIQATRGCPYKCIYCHNLWPKTHSRRSSDNIFGEILQCYKAGIRKFSILDDIFNLDIADSLRVFQSIIQHKLKVELYFPNGLRGDILSKEYIDVMVEAGLVHLALSLETASERLQKVIGKNLNISKFRENIDYIACKYPHVILDLFTMHGFPTETEAEAMETLAFIESIKWIHFPYVFVLKIFPNSPVYDFAIQNGVSKEAIEKSIKYAYHEVSDTLPFPKEFSIMYQSRVFNEYILNKERLLHVLPYQMKLLTEVEFLNQYDIYFPQGINSMSDLLKTLNIREEELGEISFRPEDTEIAAEFSQNIKQFFPVNNKKEDALKVMLIDVSQLFTTDSERHNNLNEEPLGLMYLLTSLNETFKETLSGRIIKPVVQQILEDFQPDVIGIRSLSAYKDFFHQTIAHIRYWGITVPIITGGPYAASSYKTLLQDRNIDVAVIGEGEATFNQLINEIIKHNKQLPSRDVLAKIAGIAFVKERGEVTFLGMNLLVLIDQLELAKVDKMTLPSVHNPNDLSYITYTSGTTGLPKGIMIEQAGLINIFKNWIQEYRLLDSQINVLQIAGFSFDVFIGDFLKALMTGGCLVIADESQRKDLSKLAELIQKEHITLIESTPNFVGLIINYLVRMELLFESLRMLIIGGESASIDMYRDLLIKTKGKVRVINGYGVSEGTIESCIYEASFIDFFQKGNCPIGKPFPGVDAYIVKEDMSLADEEEGELYLGGSSVLRSYINAADDSQQRIIKNPFGSGRVYRTGDLVIKQSDGNIMYVGRKDDQIKIRGYRIEPVEIETVLMNIEEIDRCLVVGRKGKIVAYYTSPEPIGEATLIQEIKTHLPDYMMPAFFVHLQKFPISSNGKIERRSLPPPETLNTNVEESKNETQLEKDLIRLWKTVLNINVFSVYDSFFDLGGDSLDCVRIITEINSRGYDLKVTDVYNYRSIHALAAFMESQKKIPVDKKHSLHEIKVHLEQEFNTDVSYRIMTIKLIGLSYNVLIVKDANKHNAICAYMNKHYSFELLPNYIFESEASANEFFLSRMATETVPEILKDLRHKEIMYSNQIVSSNIHSEYANLSYESNFRAIFRQVYFFGQIVFDKSVDEHQLSGVIRDVFKAQRLLCSIIIKQKNHFYFREYEVPENLSIPYLDLSKNSPTFNYSFITEVLNKYYQKIDKLRGFPFRVLLIKADLKQYYMGFLMDEAIHDKVGVDIFMQTVVSILENSQKQESKHYRDYISSNNAGPNGISSEEIISSYHLQDFESFSRQVKRAFLSNAASRPSMFSMRHKLTESNFLSNQWENSLKLFVMFCKQMLNIDMIPMVVVYDARSYDQFAYRNTIGEFMDFVPVLIDAKKMDMEEISQTVRDSLDLAAQHNINFINMYHSKVYPKSYQKVKKLAESCVGPLSKSDSLLIFHFRTELDSSTELHRTEQIGSEVYPWLKGIYFGITVQNNEVVLNLNLPFQMNKTELNQFFKDEIENL